MRIISKFKDYYDNLQTHDEEGLLYLRETAERDLAMSAGSSTWSYRKEHNRTEEERKFEDLNALRNSIPHMGVTFGPEHHKESLQYEKILVGFCGKFYPILRYSFPEVTGKGEVCNTYKIRSVVVSEPESLKAFLLKYRSKLFKADKWLRRFEKLQTEEEKPVLVSRWRSYTWSSRSEGFTAKGWRKWEEEQRVPASDSLFIELQAPVFALVETNNPWGEHSLTKPSLTLVLNPDLSAYDFSSIVDPYTALQEIEMYLGGPLAKDEMPPTERDDKLIAHAHGFNDVSFKKLPTKKHKRRKNR